MKAIQLVIGITIAVITLIIAWMALAGAEEVKVITLKREIELLAQAGTLRGRLPTATTDYLKGAADGIKLDRPLRVQEQLFRDDLSWQNRGFSKKQADLMVFVIVALSLRRVEVEVTKLKERDDPWARSRIGRISIYKYQAFVLLDKLSEGLKDLSPSEFSFYF
jgi:hypothetical protein